MTRPKLVPLLFGCLLAIPLAACASTPSVDETAAEAGVSSSDADPGGNPGGPGGDTDTGGGGGGGGGGNPGAPGDVAVFEEEGVEHSALREHAATKCANGVCTLLEPVPTAGDPDDVGGLDECIIQKKSDIHYDPPAHDGVFQQGATVQAHVDCTTGGSEESTETTDESGTTDESEESTETTDDSGGSETSDSGTTDSGTTDEAPADEPQG